MAIGRVSGPMLTSNLERQGVDLSIENDLLYVDVTNDRIGVKTALPTVELEVNGNIKADNLTANSITIGNSTVDSLDTGNIRLEGNTISTTNTDGNLILAPDGLGNISVNGTYVTDLATPLADTDASNKGYVDSLFGNVSISGNSISSNDGALVLGDDVNVTSNLTVTGDVNTVDITSTGVLDIGNIQVGNISLVDNTISSTNTDGNILLDPNGDGYVTLIGTNGFIPPVGTTGDRPTSPPEGLTRFNSSLELLEFWDGSVWRAAGPEAGTISAQTLEGDGSTTVFTLEKSTSTEAVIVSTNGTVQKPTTAYEVSGNQITFVEAPANGDTIDVRFITLTYSFDSISLNVLTRTEVLARTTSTTGDIVYVTDGDSGNPCLAVYNGSAWKRVAFDGDL